MDWSRFLDLLAFLKFAAEHCDFGGRFDPHAGSFAINRNKGYDDSFTDVNPFSLAAR